MGRGFVVLSLATMLIVAMGTPALATIHPLANMECANSNASAVVATQDPPGLTGGSNAGNIAQPVIAVVFIAPGGGGTSPALKPPVCPAP